MALSDSTELKNSENWLRSLSAIFVHKTDIRVNILITT
ncbi:hypothetical protein CRYPD_349 [uncultured Candidatus Thioglobus sp.]|nr:hypothetical protein CRYPD_349 [uncultured Candidatus Thioglobus sp.]